MMKAQIGEHQLGKRRNASQHLKAADPQRVQEQGLFKSHFKMF
jgi:hypothetical protein